MSRGNPEKAIAALIPSPLEAVPGVVVRPMTLGMWAALERIKSPLVTGDEPKDTLEIVPSLYLITHDPREIFRPDFLDAAMQWADTMPVDVVAAIDKAARRQIDAAVDVIPEDDGKTSKKKKTTDGSRSSSTGRRRPTDGASSRSSGKSRSPRSASCGGRQA